MALPIGMNTLPQRQRVWQGRARERYLVRRSAQRAETDMKATILAAALTAFMPATALAGGPLVNTLDGTVEGKSADQVETFLGIPYGANTGGANRFQPPRTPRKWTGVRPATAMGPRCPQVTHKVPHDLLVFSNAPISEDCLVLNVWKPAVSAKHPVMVWIHGGGFGFGSANDPLYDGASLARNEQVVVVSVNHRLNALGYLDLGPDGGGAANVGQLDLVLALRWVKANIARFGGDPANVTIFGQSGGGAKVSTLLAMPSAKGLFQKAIVESGAYLKAQTPADALAQRDRLLAKLNLKPTEAWKLRTVPIAALTAAIDAIGVLSFAPWVDGTVLPRNPFTPDAPTTARGVPLLIGTARDEATAILAANTAWQTMTEANARAAIAPLVGAGNVDRAMTLYQARRPADPAPQIYASIFTDYGFTHNAHVLAMRQAANGAPVWAYRTDWQSPVLGGVLRSPHGVELAFLFDTQATAQGMVGVDPQPGLVRLFQHSFAAFARTGNPNVAGQPTWRRYDAKRHATFVYDLTPHVINDPDPAIRAFWDEITKEPTGPAQIAK